ncbi:MAG: peptidylprolyl isomerase [Spirochaetaceae bacterium]|nr:MAG: peptidylprolyl isomerase [Spirochaetaceae bacterium]
MKRFWGFVFLCALSGAVAGAQILDQPVAVVRLTETVNIGQRELRQQARLLEQQIGRELTLDNRRELLEAQIAEVLISQAAKRANIRVSESEINQAITQQRQSLGQPVTDEQFRRIVEQQMGMNWSEYREQIRERLVQEKYVLEKRRSLLESAETPTDREIRDFYEDNATQFTNPTMVRFKHVFIDTRNLSSQDKAARRRLADELLRSVRNGVSSIDQLIDDSDDDARFSGGDFGYLIRQESPQAQLLGRSFVNQVFELEEGQLARDVLESNVGYHIVQVTHRRSARLLQLDDPVFPGQSTTVRDQIRNHLALSNQQRAFQRAINEVVDELRQEADVTLYEENLNW